jgi:hypothetical protein
MEDEIVEFYKLIWTMGFTLLTVYLCTYKRMDVKIAVFSYMAFVAYHIFMGFTTGWGYKDLSIIASYIFLSVYLPKFIKKYIK